MLFSHGGTGARTTGGCSGAGDGSMEVRFKRKGDWALLPYKHRADRTSATEDADVYARSFRWIRRSRTAAACRPWRMAREMGWVVPSPVDIVMTPIRDIELACPPEDMDLLARASNLAELWKRDESYLALEPNNWMRLYDVHTS